MRFLLMMLAVCFGLFLEAATYSTVSEINSIQRVKNSKDLKIGLQNGTTLDLNSPDGKEILQKLERAQKKHTKIEFTWNENKEITSLKTPNP